MHTIIAIAAQRMDVDVRNLFASIFRTRLSVQEFSFWEASIFQEFRLLERQHTSSDWVHAITDENGHEWIEFHISNMNIEKPVLFALSIEAVASIRPTFLTRLLAAIKSIHGMTLRSIGYERDI
eukprot:5459733-Pleurochrysis_carterae.AAC.1